MLVSQQELGQRLRAAREACRMTQDEVGRHLHLSGPTVAQMELGNRAISSTELDQLAYLFGRDIHEFLADEFHEKNALVALFHVHPDVAEQNEIVDALRRCLALGCEVKNLERLLGIDRDLGTIASYPLPAPRNKWQAVKQGERVSNEERSRLRLGTTPLADVAEVLAITEAELERLKKQEERGKSSEVAALLDLPEPDHEVARNAFRHRFLSLGLEALRRGEITRAKLEELVQMVDLRSEELVRLLCDIGLDDSESEGDVLVPKG